MVDKGGNAFPPSLFSNRYQLAPVSVRRRRGINWVADASRLESIGQIGRIDQSDPVAKKREEGKEKLGVRGALRRGHPAVD